MNNKSDIRWFAIFINMNLEDCVLGWASSMGVPELFESWVQELKDLGIGNMQALQIIARGNRWEKFLENTKCDILAELLNDWKKELSK